MLDVEYNPFTVPIGSKKMYGVDRQKRQMAYGAVCSRGYLTNPSTGACNVRDLTFKNKFRAIIGEIPATPEFAKLYAPVATAAAYRQLRQNTAFRNKFDPLRRRLMTAFDNMKWANAIFEFNNIITLLIYYEGSVVNADRIVNDLNSIKPDLDSILKARSIMIKIIPTNAAVSRDALDANITYYRIVRVNGERKHSLEGVYSGSAAVHAKGTVSIDILQVSTGNIFSKTFDKSEQDTEWTVTFAPLKIHNEMFTYDITLKTVKADGSLGSKVPSAGIDTRIVTTYIEKPAGNFIWKSQTISDNNKNHLTFGGAIGLNVITIRKAGYHTRYLWMLGDWKGDIGLYPKSMANLGGVDAFGIPEFKQIIPNGVLYTFYPISVPKIRGNDIIGWTNSPPGGVMIKLMNSKYEGIKDLQGARGLMYGGGSPITFDLERNTQYYVNVTGVAMNPTASTLGNTVSIKTGNEPREMSITRNNVEGAPKKLSSKADYTVIVKNGATYENFEAGVPDFDVQIVPKAGIPYVINVGCPNPVCGDDGKVIATQIKKTGADGKAVLSLMDPMTYNLTISKQASAYNAEVQSGRGYGTTVWLLPDGSLYKPEGLDDRPKRPSKPKETEFFLNIDVRNMGDPSGDPSGTQPLLSGVKVKILDANGFEVFGRVSAENNAKVSDVTDGKGFYSGLLKEGTYRVKLLKDGFVQQGSAALNDLGELVAIRTRNKSLTGNFAMLMATTQVNNFGKQSIVPVTVRVTKYTDGGEGADLPDIEVTFTKLIAGWDVDAKDAVIPKNSNRTWVTLKTDANGIASYDYGIPSNLDKRAISFEITNYNGRVVKKDSAQIKKSDKEKVFNVTLTKAQWKKRFVIEKCVNSSQKYYDIVGDEKVQVGASGQEQQYANYLSAELGRQLRIWLTDPEATPIYGAMVQIYDYANDICYRVESTHKPTNFKGIDGLIDTSNASARLPKGGKYILQITKQNRRTIIEDIDNFEGLDLKFTMERTSSPPGPTFVIRESTENSYLIYLQEIKMRQSKIDADNAKRELGVICPVCGSPWESIVRAKLYLGGKWVGKRSDSEFRAFCSKSTCSLNINNGEGYSIPIGVYCYMHDPRDTRICGETPGAEEASVAAREMEIVKKFMGEQEAGRYGITDLKTDLGDDADEAAKDIDDAKDDIITADENKDKALGELDLICPKCGAEWSEVTRDGDVYTAHCSNPDCNETKSITMGVYCHLSSPRDVDVCGETPGFEENGVINGENDVLSEYEKGVKESEDKIKELNDLLNKINDEIDVPIPNLSTTTITNTTTTTVAEGGNTALYIAAGVGGLALLGGIAYLMSKKGGGEV